MVSLEHRFFFTSVQYIMYVHACHISLLYVYFSAGRQYLGDSDSEIWSCVKYSMSVCVRAQDIFALAEVTWIWSIFLFLGVSLPFLLSPPLPSPPLHSTPLLSPRSDLARSLNTDEAVALGAVYQAAALSKGFRVKTFLIKDANTFPVEVRVMSGSVMGRR